MHFPNLFHHHPLVGAAEMATYCGSALLVWLGVTLASVPEVKVGSVPFVDLGQLNTVLVTLTGLVMGGGGLIMSYKKMRLDEITRKQEEAEKKQVEAEKKQQETEDKLKAAVKAASDQDQRNLDKINDLEIAAAESTRERKALQAQNAAQEEEMRKLRHGFRDVQQTMAVAAEVKRLTSDPDAPRKVIVVNDEAHPVPVDPQTHDAGGAK